MEQEKQVIYFSDLLFSALYRWKIMVAVALILALALGGLTIISGGNSTADQDAAASVAHSQNQIQIISDNILSQQEYMDNSILMTMDPYNVNRITTDFYVYTDYQILPGMEYQNPDKTPAVLRAYKMLLHSQEALDAFCQATGLPAAYLPELITTEVVTNSNALNIIVRCPDSATAEALTDAIVSYLENAKSSVEQQIAKHDISAISSPSNSPVDLELAKTQTEAATRLTTLRQSLTDANTELKTLQNYASDTKSAGPVLMAVIGAVLGVLLVCGWSVAAHFASDKVYSGRVLENRTGIRVLGAVPGNSKFKLLRKLEGRAAETNMDVIAMNIRNYCDGKKEILCLGSWNEQQNAALLDALQQLGITAGFEGSLLTSAAALKALPEAEAVILLTQCGKSRYTQTEKEMLLIADQDKALLGCVLLGG